MSDGSSASAGKLPSGSGMSTQPTQQFNPQQAGAALGKGGMHGGMQGGANPMQQPTSQQFNPQQAGAALGKGGMHGGMQGGANPMQHPGMDGRGPGQPQVMPTQQSPQGGMLGSLLGNQPGQPMPANLNPYTMQPPPQQPQTYQDYLKSMGPIQVVPQTEAQWNASRNTPPQMQQGNPNVTQGLGSLPAGAFAFKPGMGPMGPTGPGTYA